MANFHATAQGPVPFTEDEEIEWAAEQAAAEAAKPAQVKAEQWEKIKAERDRRKAGGVKIPIDGVDYWFHSDDPSRMQYAILDAKASRSGWPDGTVIHPQWKTMSGAKVPMTVAMVRQILDAGISLEAAIFDKAEAHRAAMEASSDPPAYDYSADWPLSYGE